MLSVEDALVLVLRHCRPLSTVELPPSEALGLVLAADILSDVDSPPHDKAIVDGYAVRSADFDATNRQRAAGEFAHSNEGWTLDLLEEVTAGKLPRHEVVAGTATRVMTGAPIPRGADAMVMIEQTEFAVGAGAAQGRVTIRAERVVAGQNIMPRGASFRRGDVAIAAGAPLRPIEIGVCAEVGGQQVTVVPRPTVGILPTGDELIPANRAPAPGQIRNSNGPMLAACVERAGGVAIELGIGVDQRDALRALIERGFEHDLLLISGGVSAGVSDLAPGVLRELGVGEVFHKIRLKPGKPLWFGVRECQPGAARRTLVFGLPGNPVSSLVCFELFVRPAIEAVTGRAPRGPSRATARLTAPYEHHGDRATYHPARVVESPGGDAVTPLKWRGSGDLRTLVDANALAIFAEGTHSYSAGDEVPIMRL